MGITGTVTAEDSQQQFLKLLVTKVQNQDPLDPTNQEDFISQLAQFSTLEGIENLNAKFSDMLALQHLTNGAQLVGKSVRFPDTNGTTVAKVDEVSVIDNRLMLSVGRQLIPIDSVLGIVDAA